MTFEKWDNKLENFPPFDPTWPDEVKLNWYRTFDEILNMSNEERETRNRPGSEGRRNGVA